jgi:hypothetical protein
MVTLVATSVSLSGCVFFSNAFWQCMASGGLNKGACAALSDYLDQAPGDFDGDGVRNPDDECPWEPSSNPLTGGCPDRDGDGRPDHRDACPDQPAITSPDGCPASPPGAPDTTPPPAPTGLTATGQAARIRLSWVDSTASDLAGYHVERATSSGGPYTQITSALLTDSEYDDFAVAPNVPYYYVVTAVDLSGNRSPRSAEVSATRTPSLASARIGLAAAGKSYRARVTGRFVRARSFRARNGVLAGRGLVFTGRLAAARGAPAALRRAGWTARMDLSVSGPRARATARGVVLAKFGSGGRLCLRFTQRMRVRGGGRRVLGGSFKVIGATGAARQLGSASRFSGAAGRRGAWTLRASGKTGKRLPSALPRACRGF